MDGKGRALDNIFAERLWRSMKYEEARQGVVRYLHYYNHERQHQSLAQRIPAEVYTGL